MAFAGNSALLSQNIVTQNQSVNFKNWVYGVVGRSQKGLFNVGKPNNGKWKMQVGVQSVDSVKIEKSFDGSLVFDVMSERELSEKGFLGLRKTKIVCTIGPSCCSLEDLESLALEGMNVARFNMCHNTKEWHWDAIRRIKKLNKEKGFCVSVMIDTEGSQIHGVDHGAPSSIKAEVDSVWLFTATKFEGSRPFTVQANYEGFSEGIMVGDQLVIDGGMATFEVLEKIGNDLRCKCTDPGLFLPRAKLSFWRDGKLVEKNHQLPTLSTQDWSDIDFGVSEGVDFIAVSFVNDADVIRELKNHLATKTSRSVKVIAKIESLESLHNLEDIVEASDGVMVARVDLGVEVPLEQIPTVQERITSVCRQLNKPVIVASQLLESMIEYPIPTRAEVADVSEAVRQYADALMLSSETAIGSYGQKALSILRTTSTRMEQWSQVENQPTSFQQRQLGISLSDRIAEQICNGAVEMANNLGVDAIFVYTKYGYMASLLSRNRPCPPIVAFTNDESTRMAMNLQWGVMPFLVELSEDVEANISRTTRLMKARGMVKEGDTVLVVSDVVESSATPTVFQSIQVKIIV